DHPGRVHRQRATVRAVPLAPARPDPVHPPAPGDDPGARVRQPAGRSGTLPAAAGGHRLDRMVVPERTARTVPTGADLRPDGHRLTGAPAARTSRGGATLCTPAASPPCWRDLRCT